MTYAEMYEIAKSKLNPRKLNKHAKICDAVAVIEAASGKVYVGVSLVATCGVGYCAEQAALSQIRWHSRSRPRLRDSREGAGLYLSRLYLLPLHKMRG